MSVAISFGRQSDTEYRLEVARDAVGVVPAGEAAAPPRGRRGARWPPRRRGRPPRGRRSIIGRSLGMSPKTRTSPNPTPYRSSATASPVAFVMPGGRTSMNPSPAWVTSATAGSTTRWARASSSSWPRVDDRRNTLSTGARRQHLVAGQQLRGLGVGPVEAVLHAQRVRGPRPAPRRPRPRRSARRRPPRCGDHRRRRGRAAARPCAAPRRARGRRRTRPARGRRCPARPAPRARCRAAAGRGRSTPTTGMPASQQASSAARVRGLTSPAESQQRAVEVGGDQPRPPRPGRPRSTTRSAPGRTPYALSAFGAGVVMRSRRTAAAQRHARGQRLDAAQPRAQRLRHVHRAVGPLVHLEQAGDGAGDRAEGAVERRGGLRLAVVAPVADVRAAGPGRWCSPTCWSARGRCPGWGTTPRCRTCGRRWCRGRRRRCRPRGRAARAPGGTPPPTPAAAGARRRRPRAGRS